MRTLDALRRVLRRPSRTAARPSPVTARPSRSPAALDPGRARTYSGAVELAYAPRHDGEPDPGEVVWTWVPFEEDASQGKDRPVVVVGRPTPPLPGPRRDDLAVVMLSSKDHHGDPDWMVVGTGDWDVERRVSSVRLDRVLAVHPDAVRREGAALDRDRFDRVAAALAARHGWPR